MWNIPQELTFLLEFWVSVFYIPFNNFSYFQNDVKRNLKRGYTREGCCTNLPLFERSIDSFTNFYEFCYCCISLIANTLLQNHLNFVPSLTLTTIRDNWYCNFYLKNHTCHVNVRVKVNLMAFWMTWYCISYFFPYSVPWFLFYK